MWWGKCPDVKYCLEVLASRQRTRHSPRDFHISLNGGVGGGIKSLSFWSPFHLVPQLIQMRGVGVVSTRE